MLFKINSASLKFELEFGSELWIAILLAAVEKVLLDIVIRVPCVKAACFSVCNSFIAAFTSVEDKLEPELS